MPHAQPPQRAVEIEGRRQQRIVAASGPNGAPAAGQGRSDQARQASRNSRLRTLPIALRGSSFTSFRADSRCVLPTRALSHWRRASPRLAASGGHDEGHRRLAPFDATARRRRPHSATAGCLASYGLQVAGIDVEAAVMIMSFLRSSRVKEAVGVEAADIAGADEALAVGAGPLGLGGLGRLVVIARHHGRPSGRPPRRSRRRHFAALLVDQPDVVACGRLAHRVQLVWKLVRAQAGRSRRPRSCRRYSTRPPGQRSQHVGLELGGERRAGADLHAKGRQVDNGRSRVGPSAAGTAPAPAWRA